MNIIKITAKTAKLIENEGLTQARAQEIAVKIMEMLLDEIINNGGLTKEEAQSFR
jgi:hypothetical protein